LVGGDRPAVRRRRLPRHGRRAVGAGGLRRDTGDLPRRRERFGRRRIARLTDARPVLRGGADRIGGAVGDPLDQGAGGVRADVDGAAVTLVGGVGDVVAGDVVAAVIGRRLPGDAEGVATGAVVVGA